MRALLLLNTEKKGLIHIAPVETREESAKKSHLYLLRHVLQHANMRLQGLRTPGEEIAFTARPKVKSQSQIFRDGRSIFCLPYLPKISDFLRLCLHWVSIVLVFKRYMCGLHVGITSVHKAIVIGF